jgi:hypothetical protein
MSYWPMGMVEPSPRPRVARPPPTAKKGWPKKPLKGGHPQRPWGGFGHIIFAQNGVGQPVEMVSKTPIDRIIFGVIL